MWEAERNAEHVSVCLRVPGLQMPGEKIDYFVCALLLAEENSQKRAGHCLLGESESVLRMGGSPVLGSQATSATSQLLWLTVPEGFGKYQISSGPRFISPHPHPTHSLSFFLQFPVASGTPGLLD